MTSTALTDLDRLADLLELQSGDRVLVWGVRDGALDALRMAWQSPAATILCVSASEDFNERARIQAADENVTERVSFTTVADVADLASWAETKSFDKVLVLQAAEDLRGRTRFFSVAQQQLVKTGGRLVVWEGNSESWLGPCVAWYGPEPTGSINEEAFTH